MLEQIQKHLKAMGTEMDTKRIAYLLDEVNYGGSLWPIYARDDNDRDYQLIAAWRIHKVISRKKL